MNFDEFVTALEAHGWRNTCDAQHTEIRKLFDELNQCGTGPACCYRAAVAECAEERAEAVEREAFEKSFSELYCRPSFERDSHDVYERESIYASWVGWQARAALSQPVEVAHGIAHTCDEDFEHYLTYKGLLYASSEIIAAARDAFEAAWRPRPSAIEKFTMTGGREVRRDDMCGWALHHYDGAVCRHLNEYECAFIDAALRALMASRNDGVAPQTAAPVQSDDAELPTLPEPDSYRKIGSPLYREFAQYTADQMREYARAAIASQAKENEG